MPVIDMHCDSLMLAYLHKKHDMLKTSGMVDLERMKQGGVMAQFFAAFMMPEGIEKWFPDVVVPEDHDYIETCAEILHGNITDHAELIAEATNAQEIIANDSLGKMSAVFTIEDGRAVEGKLENIDWLYKLGVRAISLTWNVENCFGFPNSDDSEVMQKGLTDFGKDAVLYLQEKGILVDVSHLSDGGFRDVAAICKKPFIASHSNCRAISPHKRNLTDDMVKELANHGGVMGLNFGPEFLNKDITSKENTIEAIIAMAKHVKNVGGNDVLAIGSDFDGISGNLEIDSCAKFPLLFEELSKNGFSSSEIEGVSYKNTLRVLTDAL